LAISDTLGFNDFSISLRLFTANDVTNNQTYAVEYRVGNSGNFTQIGSTYTTGIPFNATSYSVNSVTLSALNNQSSNVYVRVRGTIGTGQSGSLDTIGLDDFNLSYSAIPEPSTYAAMAGTVALFGAVWHRRRVGRVLGG
jgi:hypothetical protein